MILQLVQNVTSSSKFYYTSDLGGSLGGLLVTLIFCAIVIGTAIFAMFVVSRLERYKKVWAAISTLVDVIVHGIIGAIVLAALGVCYYLFTMGASKAGQVEPMLYALAFGGFVLSVTVGYAATWFAGRLKKVHGEYVAEIKAAAPAPETPQ